METFYPGCEAGADLSAKAVFVDLDETFLEGTVVNMTDEELEAAEIKYRTLSLIMSAVSKGIPVIMVTRNNHTMIDRFFNAKPYLRGLFKELIPCPIGPKSGPIKAYMEQNGISPKQAIFLDDTSVELDDVRKNVEGILATHPDTADMISLDGEADILESRRRMKILLAA